MPIVKKNIEELSKAQLLKAEKLVEITLLKKRNALYNDLVVLGSAGEAILAEVNGAPRVVSLKTKGRKSKKMPARFRNPLDTKQTWTGRGRHPDWVKKYVARGGKLQDCIITQE